ncbi:touch receptor neuron protein Mec-17-domain-containing protein [Gamsiella multidivaricata]|uniref:touch receptor neuron protein Mec-17-domain-containing protein n=1 Tax=Gamsiella multidivaricata TaxID=101098 RepID=UPI0022209C63|nr:touch receptor neuron protein Mec-17-domain-containing protein [Gamsiella multidivaricata]KAG0360186.1 Alpha-tubulin N-acetyltransferase 1 [Gamsiella multidivaricata]KAI7831764.1 touch receptor neuron protein Mec-17-domain-containing protein [Gamsiella multidivaricata]
MDFDFPLIPLLPLPITLVPAATFAALEHNQIQIQQAFASSVSIGLSKNSANGGASAGANGSNSTSSSFSSSSLSSYPTGGLAASSDQERLGAIVDALGQASAKAQELPTSITQTLRLAKNPTQRVYILRTGLDSGEDQWLNQLEIGSPLMKESLRKSVSDLNGPSLSTIGNSNSGWDSDTAGTSSTAVSSREEESRRSQRTRSEEKGVYVAGMLKIGEKKLFIVDKSGTMHEQEVCCVLDFYVDDSCQRRGYGKLLFDYMLKVENIEPAQIAYDRPSPKLYRFLSKYFRLERHLPQPNMFAIFEGFKLLDCGEIIQVNDDYSLPAVGRTSVSFIPSSSASDNSSSNSGTVNNSNSGTSGTRTPTISRALQSSVVFSSGAPATDSINIQANRRVSSAFSSSISLSAGTDAGSIPIAPTTRPQQTQTGGPPSGARISRLLASSIKFADPIVSTD